MRPAKTMALGGVLAALAVTVMLLGGLFPMATYCAPLLAMLMLIPVKAGCGNRVAWTWYLTVAILSVLLCPDKETAGVFVAMGAYPIVKPRLDAIRPRWLGMVVKGMLFAVVTAALYAALILLMGMWALWEDFSAAGWILGGLTMALGLVTFFVSDRLVEKLSRLAARKMRPFK